METDLSEYFISSISGKRETDESSIPAPVERRTVYTGFNSSFSFPVLSEIAPPFFLFRKGILGYRILKARKRYAKRKLKKTVCGLPEVTERYVIAALKRNLARLFGCSKIRRCESVRRGSQEDETGMTAIVTCAVMLPLHPKISPARSAPAKLSESLNASR